MSNLSTNQCLASVPEKKLYNPMFLHTAVSEVSWFLPKQTVRSISADLFHNFYSITSAFIDDTSVCFCHEKGPRLCGQVYMPVNSRNVHGKWYSKRYHQQFYHGRSTVFTQRNFVADFVWAKWTTWTR